MQQNPFANPILMLTFAVLAATGSTGVSNAEEPDFARLANRYVGMVRTRNPTPLAEIGQMISDDFLQSTSLGTVFRGKAANMELYRKSIAGIRAGLSLLDVNIVVQSVREYPQIAVLFGKITMSGRLRDNAPFQRVVWETIVFRKQGAKWLMVHEHSTVAAPAGKKG